MGENQLAIPLPQAEKAKVAYALNLCAVSISQIIDSRDMIVLKQEREAILNNLNLQNFVKHPALLDVLKRILDTITFLEIQAGDMSFIEKEYQHKLKNAIWSAIPSPGVLLGGGSPVAIAIAVATQIGTGYMNYRKNKSQYLLDREKSEWELRRHEIEQLYGLRAQLFETAWKLSADYDFDDRYRLTEKQLSRYSEALLEPDPLKRFERLDVMADKFAAFPPYWYYKGNAAMEVFRSDAYSFSAQFKRIAIEAYETFHTAHFAFLREDIIAASCCLEHISLLEPADAIIPELLEKALRFAGENYDVLQQAVLVYLQRRDTDSIIGPLREMIANDYNIGLNGDLLSRIYINRNNRDDYAKLLAIAPEHTFEWSDNAEIAAEAFYSVKADNLAKEFEKLAKRIVPKLKAKQLSEEDRQEFAAVVGALKTFFEESGPIGSILTDISTDFSLKRSERLIALSRQLGESLRNVDFQTASAELANVIHRISIACRG